MLPRLNTVFGQIPNLAYLSSSSSENQNNTFKRSPDYFPSAQLKETNTIDSDTSSNSSSVSGYNSNTKVVIINFDDSYKSQYVYAKPILDKYGFKATFFEVCNWIRRTRIRRNTKMTWQDIAELYEEGFDSRVSYYES